jgi:tetratricopeptide (TPR) repeat protein
VSDFLALALTALGAGDCPQAYRLLVSLLREEPGNAAAWFQMGGLLERLKRWSSAVIAFWHADRLSPGSPQVLMALGWHLHLAGRTVEAEGVLRRCLEIDPGLGMAHTNLGHVLATLGRDEEALGYAFRGCDLEPMNSLARLGLAFQLFFAKRWVEGFWEYEARFLLKFPEMAQVPYPRWDGGRAKHLFLQGEQGLGDTIQMLRYMPAVLERVERVTLYVQPALVGLCREMWPSVEVHGMPRAIPLDADAWRPLMSLPIVFGAPAWDGAYLWGVVIPRRALWPPRRIGICWAGDPAHDNDAHRSIPLATMLRFAEIPGIELVSLQAGARGTADIQAQNAESLIEDMGPELVDMCDTVRAVEGLDLVISVDTAVLHLAGAMGVPAIALINQFGCDWRWSRADAVSEWYPSVSIRRRALDEQWSAVIERVCAELSGGRDSAAAGERMANAA